MDISLSTAALQPAPSYTTGLLFFLPMAIQGGVSTLCSLVIFPESVGHSFQTKLGGVIGPLATAYTSVEALFASSVNYSPETSPQLLKDRLSDWADRSKTIRSQLLESLAGLTPLRAQQRYLKVDFSYGRLSGEDLRDVFDLVAVIQTRSGGVAVFFDVVLTNAKHLHLDSSAYSVHDPQSQPPSRPPSVNEDSDEDESDSERPTSRSRFSTSHLSVRNSSGFNLRSSSPLRNQHAGSHISLLDRLRKLQQPVGVYESQRYMDIERSFSEYVKTFRPG